jgi:VCBS repeat-containing protein
VATVNITVNPVNDAPFAGTDTYSTAEDTSLVLAVPGVLSNDTDAEGSPLTAVLVTGPAHGALVLNANGSFTYTPTANYNGPDSFTYQANDGSLNSSVAIVNITVTPVNDAPVAANNSYSTNEDTQLSIASAGVLANDSDVDGNPLSAVLVTGPAHGTLVLNVNGSFTYTPTANYNGPDSFTYRANDGSLNSNEATVNITVSPLNDAPVAANNSYSTNEDTLLSIAAAGVLANDSDVDGNPLSAVLVTGPAHGSLVLNANGSFTYTPVANYNGPDSFTYRANDGSLNSNVATVNITVTPVNDAPIAANNSYSTNEDTQLSIAAAGVLANDSDVDGNPLSAVLVTGPAHGTLVLNTNGSFTYTPTSNYNGPDSFTYKAKDGSLNSNVATVNITVTPVNDAPVAASDAFSTAEDTSLTVAVPGILSNDSDVDGNSLTAVLVTGPAHGTLVLNTNGSFTYTPTANYSGPDSFTYRANDGLLSSNVATVSIAVTSSNDAPVAVNNSYSTNEDTLLSIPATGILTNDTDVDATLLTAILVAGPTHGTLTLNANGSFTYTPVANYNGPDSFTYRANDGLLNSNVATVSITVNPVNDAPIANNDTFSADEDTPLIISTAGILENDSDVDGNSLSAVLVTGPAHGTLVLNADGSFTYTPTANYTGSDSFTYRANDGSLNSNVATVDITVNTVNNPPNAVNDFIIVPFFNVPFSPNVDVYDVNVNAFNGVLTNDTDPEGDEITVTTADFVFGDYGILYMNVDGSYGYNFYGGISNVGVGSSVLDSFTYEISDGHGGTDTATLGIMIRGTENVVKEDLSAYRTVSGNIGVSGPFLTSVSSDFFNYADSFLILPNGNWTFQLRNSSPIVQDLGEGDMVFLHIQILDSNQDFLTSIPITVLGTNDPAFFYGTETGSVFEDRILSTSGDLHIIDFDSGEELFIPILTPQHGDYGDFTLQIDGHWTYNLRNADANVQVLDTGETVQDVFTVYSFDGTSEQVTITVDGRNEGNSAPFIVPQANPGYFLSNSSLAVNFDDYDIVDQGDALTYSLVNAPAGVSINPTTGIVTTSYASGRHYKSLTGTSVRATDSFGVPTGLVALNMIFDASYYSSIQFGTNGDNSLTASQLNQVLIGLGGNDVLTGSSGNDLLIGNNDLGKHTVYKFNFTTGNMGHDTILEIDDFRDILQFQGAADITEVNDGITSFSNNNGAVQINFDNGGSLTLANILYSSLTNSEKAAHDIMSLVNGANVNPGLISVAGETFSGNDFTYLYNMSLHIDVTQGGAFTNNTFSFDDNFGFLTLTSGSSTQTQNSTLSNNTFIFEQSLSRLIMNVDGGNATATMSNNTFTFLGNTVIDTQTGLHNASLFGDIDAFLYSTTNGGVAQNNTISFGGDTLVGSTASGLGGFTERMYGDLASMLDLLYEQTSFKLYTSLDGYLSVPTNHVAVMGGNTFIANSYNNIMFGIGGYDILPQNIMSWGTITESQIEEGIATWANKGYHTVYESSLHINAMGMNEVTLFTKFEPVGAVINPNTFVFDLDGIMGANSIVDFSMERDILEFHGVAPGATTAETIQNVDAMIASITGPGPGWASTWWPFEGAQWVAYIPGTVVTFTNGGVINFGDVPYTGQTSIGELVDHNTQIHAVLV